MSSWLKRFLPTAESVKRRRWLRWLGPGLHHPRVWRLTRRGLALGVAIGVFFGLLIPLAQIPLSAATAIAVRANLPGAVAGTLVTNPVTVGPVYYAAWRLGSAILGAPAREGEAPAPGAAARAIPDTGNPLETAWRRVAAVGKPLLLGLALLAVGAGLVTYLLVSWVWTLSVLWQRQRRRGRRGQA